jgi:hypothetical protein
MSLPRFACIVHAVIVCADWVLTFQFNLDILPGKIWLVLALAWFAWPFVLLLARREDRTQWGVAVGVGMLVLVPTIPTLYTFLVWAIEGFAP